MVDRISFRPPPEPAHVSVVRLYEELLAILQYIRHESQEAIDEGFDRASSQIGFVVATSLPVTVEVAEGGKITQLTMREEHLKGTLFEKELLPSVHKLLQGPIPTAGKPPISQGSFDIYLLWFEALKLKLGSISFRPPPEPAHFQALSAALARFRPPPEPAHYYLERFRPPPEPAHYFLGRFRPPPEPAHWFDPGIRINHEEQALIIALNEVYPELQLTERISASRHSGDVALNPQPLPPRAAAEELAGIAAPYPSPWRALAELLIKELENPEPSPWRELVTALVEELGKAYPVPDPWKAKILENLAEVIRRYR